MRFERRKDIREAGFEGFERIASLRASKLAQVPRKPGVYLVLRGANGPPRFLPRNPAYHHKGQDPTVSRAVLQASWIGGTPVLYIGKAGTQGGQATLYSRLRSYLRSGEGKSAAHWGGRYIWQLADANALLVAWRRAEAQESRAVERELLQTFVKQYGRRPFANRAG